MQQRRRDLLAASTVLPALAQTAPSPQFVKSICGAIFPPAMPLREQFRRTKAAGFEGIEIRLGNELRHDTSKDDARRIADQAREAGVAIVSIWVSASIAQTPLNHSDPAVRAQGVAIVDQAIDLATHLNCGAILIVPGRLGTTGKLVHGYQDTWDRVTGECRKLTAHAEKAQVYLTPENVWNKFLLSPLEMRAFVDQFGSPYFQTHFDIGNVMQFGYPEDWILTLGSRIRRVHVKDYKLSTRAEQGRFVDLLEGDVDWPAVMTALKKVGYRGFMSPEYGARADDPEHLLKVSRALDRILALA